MLLRHPAFQGTLEYHLWLMSKADRLTSRRTSLQTCCRVPTRMVAPTPMWFGHGLTDGMLLIGLVICGSLTLGHTCNCQKPLSMKGRLSTFAPTSSRPGVRATGSATLKNGVSTPVSYTHLRAHETKANLVC